MAKFGKIAAAECGEGVVEPLAEHIARSQPSLLGSSAKDIWRMRLFYEAYCGQEKLSTLVRQLLWTHIHCFQHD